MPTRGMKDDLEYIYKSYLLVNWTEPSRPPQELRTGARTGAETGARTGGKHGAHRRPARLPTAASVRQSAP